MPKFDGTPYTQLTTPARGDVQGVIKDISEGSAENQTKFALLEDLQKFGGWASKVLSVTASGTVTLADTDPMFVEIDPNGSNRDVGFPAKSDNNHGYYVRHSGSANTLTLNRSGGATITSLAAGEVKYIMPSTLNDFSTLAGGSSSDGWTAGAGTWSYSSADSPIFVISINADVTAMIGVGNRIKLTQTTTKYFIVVAVGSYSAGATLVTVYGGTDYTLANAAITTPYYSNIKAPLGFPLSSAKWTVSATNTGNAGKASPTSNTWYGGSGLSVTGISVDVPIGAWYPKIKAIYEIVTPATAAGYGPRITFSSANNSESDASWTHQFSNNQTAVAGTYRSTYSPTSKVLAVASKTTYYLNVLTGQSSVTSIAMRGDVGATAIDLECVYL